MPLKLPNLSAISPTALGIKIVVGVIVVAVFWILAVAYMARGDKIKALTEWQNGVIQTVTLATVEPDSKGKRKLLKPEQINSAVAGLARTSNSCLAASAERSRLAEESKARADAADRALANVQTILRGQFQSAEARIKALESATAQPTPTLQCEAIRQDSKAAWEGWQ